MACCSNSRHHSHLALHTCLATWIFAVIVATATALCICIRNWTMDLPRSKRHHHKQQPCSSPGPVTSASSQRSARGADNDCERKFKYHSIFSSWPSASREPSSAPKEYFPSHSVLELSRSSRSTSKKSSASSTSASGSAIPSLASTRITLTARKYLQGIQEARTNWARSQYRQATVSKLRREDSGTTAATPFSSEVPPRVTVPPFQLLTCSSPPTPAEGAEVQSNDTWCNPHHQIPRLRPLSLIPFTHRSPHDQRELDQVAAQAAAEQKSSVLDKEPVELSSLAAEPSDLDTMSSLSSTMVSAFGTESNLSTWLVDGAGFGRILESNESTSAHFRYRVDQSMASGRTVQFETVASRPLYPKHASPTPPSEYQPEVLPGEGANASVPMECQSGSLYAYFGAATSNESGVLHHQTLGSRVAESERLSGYGLRELLSNPGRVVGTGQSSLGSTASLQAAPSLLRSNSGISYTLAFTTPSHHSSSAASQPLPSSSPTPSLDDLLRSSQQTLHQCMLSSSSASRRGLIPPPHNPATSSYLPPHQPGGPSMTDGWPQFQPYPRSAVVSYVPVHVHAISGSVQRHHGIPPPTIPSAPLRSALATSSTPVSHVSMVARSGTPSRSTKKRTSPQATIPDTTAPAEPTKKRRTKRTRVSSSSDMGIVTDAVPLGTSFLGLGPVSATASFAQFQGGVPPEAAKPPVKRRKKAVTAKAGKADGESGPPRPSV